MIIISVLDTSTLERLSAPEKFSGVGWEVIRGSSPTEVVLCRGLVSVYSGDPVSARTRPPASGGRSPLCIGGGPGGRVLSGFQGASSCAGRHHA